MLRMIVPIDVTDSVLTSSNITENDYPVWSAATTYALGDRVIVLSTHSIYQSVQNSNLNRNPVTDSALETPLWWVRVGATNKWKAFDDVIQDQASRSGGITYELDVASRCDGIALFNLDAESATVRVVDPTVLRRNLLVSTGDLSAAYWIAKRPFTTYIGYVADPEGGMTAQSFNMPIGSLIFYTVSGAVNKYTASFWVRSDTVTELRAGFDTSYTNFSVSPEWSKVVINGYAGSTIELMKAQTQGGVVEIWHPQAEYGSEVTEYQSVDAAGVWDKDAYNSTRDLQDYSEIEDYWSYFFAPVVRLDAIVFNDVPAFAGTTVHISINSEDVAKVGEILLGNDQYLGRIHAGASVGIQDFSRKERDTFGNYIIIERSYADTMDLNFEFDASKIAYMRRILADRRAKPTVFHGGAGFEQYGLLVYGFYKDTNFPIVTQKLCVAQLEIEGLI